MITITNSLPQATAQSHTIDEDSSLIITLSATDDDPTDLLTITPGSPAHGSLSPVDRASASQTLRYTPNHNFFGTDRFTYSVSDATDSASATITIVVAGQPDSPILSVQDSYLTSAGPAALSIVISDPDEPGGITAADYSISLSAATTGELRTSQNIVISGPVSAQALPISFTPEGGFSDETLTVLVTDPSGRSSAIRELRIASGVALQGMSLRSGWNLVSLVRDPLTFPFDNAFGWDAASQSRRRLDSAMAGDAFWTHSSRDRNLEIPGVPGVVLGISVEAGWNLIGAVGGGVEVPVPPSADIAWRWIGHFTQTTRLTAGSGVWIHFPAPEFLSLELTD